MYAWTAIQADRTEHDYPLRFGKGCIARVMIPAESYTWNPSLGQDDFPQHFPLWRFHLNIAITRSWDPRNHTDHYIAGAHEEN